ncbi:EAL domain-containing protein [Pseudaminobacter arsenicus]|uniref:EAL domain-containing protein n=1 Tax=Borborobacter arsenicus TaxID=1851146 RepID=A0A432UZR4_9HYPH|nr:EAL domain-containing protein [Pseudaminobacter arsenicus]RUM95338.1 EAL domain-containing protein [Pseudaminobacter arsenicus]
MEFEHVEKLLGLPTGKLSKILTDTVFDFIWVVNDVGSLIYGNKSWYDFTGCSAEPSRPEGWLDAVHPDETCKLRNLSKTLSPAVWEKEARFRRRDGTYVWHMLRMCPIPSSRYWLGCAIDIQDQIIFRERRSAQLRILEMVARGAEIQDVLAELCLYAEHLLSGARCSILLVDAQEGVFTGGVAPTLPPAIVGAIKGVSIRTGVGSCGTAAYEKRDVIVSDIATDALWFDFRELALSHGLHACWSRPILSSAGAVLATFGFYFLEKRAPTLEEMSSMDAITHVASLALERSHVASALAESEEHYRYSVELNSQIPWTADPAGNVLSVSPRLTAWTGIAEKDALGNGWQKALHPDDIKPTLVHWHERLTSGDPVDVQYRMRLHDDTYRWMRARAAPRRGAHGDIIRWYGTLEDVHEHKVMEDSLRRAAYVDELTRLPNRRYFYQELHQALRPAVRNKHATGLLVFDMDDFKQVNGRFGRAGGNAVLRLFAQYVRQLVKPNEIAARLGGDEFGVILKDVKDEREVCTRATRLTAALDSYLKRSTRARNCRASVGCAISTPHDTADELFKKASLALYSLKKTKQRKVQIFTPEIGGRDRQKNDQIELAWDSLRFDWIVPYYQPKVSLLDDRVVGVEALIRISHPKKGILPPAKILAALDHPHAGGELGDRMTSLIIQDLKAWRQNGTCVDNVALNVSAEYLTRPDFARRLLSGLEHARLASASIKLEITERVLIEELSGDIRKALIELREAGIGISLDDFGTGHASLTHLQRFPISEIKIDRSFIKGLESDSANAAIVKALVRLGGDLNIDVVAEGIETPDQARLVRMWGGTIAQGYYFGKPMSADKLSRFVRSRHFEGDTK